MTRHRRDDPVLDALRRAKRIRTEDGYTFYRTPDGHWVDALDPGTRDITYGTDEELAEQSEHGDISFVILD